MVADDAEAAIRQAEFQASSGCVFIPRHLHRAIDLRWELVVLQQFAQRDSAAWLALERERARPPAEDEHICIAAGGAEPYLRRARDDIRILNLRARRARYDRRHRHGV